MAESHMIVPYAVAFIRQGDQVLLTFRINSRFVNNQHALVGGKINNHETPDHAIIREIAEETGLEVKPEHVSLKNVLYFKGETRDCVAFVFVVDAWKGEPVNKEPEKHAHIKWFSLADLPADLVPRHRLMIENLKKGILYATQGL